MLWGPLVFAQGAQADSLQTRQLDEVVVTATRSDRLMGALPMPVSVVNKLQIQAMGSVRLNDVLLEQTGLAVVPQINGMGNGIQMQGLNPDYTLILLDGEPLIGRFTGSLELSRVAVGNIKQIEIVKGPSSSLYGSDALAGVINIITERPQGMKGSFGARYGSFGTLDVNTDFNYKKNKLGVYAFLNRFQTDGYDLSPERFGQTVAPFFNHTFQTNITYQFTPATDISVSVRRFDERQTFGFEVETQGARIRTFGEGTTGDWNVNTVATHRVSDRFKVIGRLYGTRYETASWLNRESDGALYYADSFEQTFLRPEINTEHYLNSRNVLTLGAGSIRETVRTSRYGDDNPRMQFTHYAFFQHEWTASSRLSVIAGGRYDYNTIYASQFSPKLSARYEVSPRVALKLSSGVGFKAPDFRQVYFNFFNAAAGYSVLGTEVATPRLQELEAAGQIQAYLFDPATLGRLQAERSVAINTGFTAQLHRRVQAEFNVFHNSINNLIETQAVAITTNNQTIFSYRNVLRAFTQGLESNFTWQINTALGLSAGYQLLFAKDRDVVDAARAGQLFGRDPVTLVTQRLQPAEYTGLYNRSRHMANVKLFYRHQKSGWEGSLRWIYRGRFGIGAIQGNIQGEQIPSSDRNSNGVLDRHDSFISGYGLVNVAVAKTVWQSLRLQVGMDNVFNHTEPVFIPNLPGRITYASFSYHFGTGAKTRKSNLTNQ